MTLSNCEIARIIGHSDADGLLHALKFLSIVLQKLFSQPDNRDTCTEPSSFTLPLSSRFSQALTDVVRTHRQQYGRLYKFATTVTDMSQITWDNFEEKLIPWLVPNLKPREIKNSDNMYGNITHAKGINRNAKSYWPGKTREYYQLGANQNSASTFHIPLDAIKVVKIEQGSEESGGEIGGYEIFFEDKSCSCRVTRSNVDAQGAIEVLIYFLVSSCSFHHYCLYHLRTT